MANYFTPRCYGGNPISEAADIPGGLQPTLKAYQVYLSSPNNPDIEQIQDRLGNQKETLFTVRLLGWAYHAKGVGCRNHGDVKCTNESLAAAKTYYERALKLAIEKNFPGDLPVEARAFLTRSVRNLAAAIEVEIAISDWTFNNGVLSQTAKDVLGQAKQVFLELISEAGDIPASYYNLIDCDSLLGQYEEAINEVNRVRSAPLKEADRLMIKKWMLDVGGNPEMSPLIAYVKQTTGKSWKEFLDKHFGF